MMYTPTPATRRPRPPSTSRRSIAKVPSTASSTAVASHTTTSHTSHQTQIPLNPSVSSSSLGSRSVSRPSASSSSSSHNRRRMSNSRMGRSTGTPDLEDVSFHLDPTPEDLVDNSQSSHISGSSFQSGSQGSNSIGRSMTVSTSGSSELGHEAEPSPPPPYGPSFTTPDTVEESTAPTPLRQDSGAGSSRRSTISARETGGDAGSERMRLRRAVEAARAMGLEVDLGAYSSRERSGGSEEELSEDTMRARLVEMKRQLRRRDDELLLAAEVANKALRTHEDLLSYLPTTVKARLPDFVHLFPHQQHTKRRTSRSASESSARSNVRSSAHHRETSTRSLQSRTYAQADLTSETDEKEVSDSIDDFMTAEDESDASRHYGTIQVKHVHDEHNRIRPPARRSYGPLSASLGISSRQAHIEALQREENDEKMMALEQALNDARESEENQRKLAARLRKEVERLNRDIERVEQEPISVKHDLLVNVDTPGLKEVARKSSWRSSMMFGKNRPITKTPSREGDYGWGLIAHPSFPVIAGPGGKAQIHEDEEEEPDLGEVSDRLRRSSSNGKRQKMVSPALSQVSSMICSDRLDTASRSSTTASTGRSSSSRKSVERLTLPGEHRKLRKRVSKTNFLDPNQADIVTPRKKSPSPSPLTPQVTVEGPDSESSNVSSSGSSTRNNSRASFRNIRRSPWPSPGGSNMSISPDPRATLEFTPPHPHDLSPAFASLSSRMATMRAFVSSALEVTPSRPTGRTLGSELGSEYGDRVDGSLRFIEETLLGRPSPARTVQSVDDDGKSVYSEYYEPPAPLPPNVSAALSSLALALAPYASPEPGRRGGDKPDLRDARFDTEGDSSEENQNILEEAFAMRKIRWADTSSNNGGSSDEVVTDSVFNVVHAIPKRPSPSTSLIDESPSIRAKPSSTVGKDKYKGISPRPRPYLRHSSDGSVALAHRRRLSCQVAPTPKSPQNQSASDKAWESINKQSPNRKTESSAAINDEEEWVEPKTIPGRLVHDIICLLAIFVDFVECAVIIIYRVILDLRYGQRDSLLEQASEDEEVLPLDIEVVSMLTYAIGDLTIYNDLWITDYGT